MIKMCENAKILVYFLVFRGGRNLELGFSKARSDKIKMFLCSLKSSWNFLSNEDKNISTLLNHA